MSTDISTEYKYVKQIYQSMMLPDTSIEDTDIMQIVNSGEIQYRDWQVSFIKEFVKCSGAMNLLNYETGAGKTLVYLTLLYFWRVPDCRFVLVIPHQLTNHICQQSIKYFGGHNLELNYARYVSVQKTLAKYSDKVIDDYNGFQMNKIEIYSPKDANSLEHLPGEMTYKSDEQYKNVFIVIDDFQFMNFNAWLQYSYVRFLYVSANDTIDELIKIQKEVITKVDVKDCSIATQSIKPKLIYHRLKGEYKSKDIPAYAFDPDQFMITFNRFNKKQKQFIMNQVFTLFKVDLFPRLEKNDREGPHALNKPTLVDDIGCVICMDDLSENMILLEPCFHLVCQDCLKESFKDDLYHTSSIKCPLCRTVCKKFYKLDRDCRGVAEEYDEYTFKILQQNQKDLGLDQLFEVEQDKNIYETLTAAYDSIPDDKPTFGVGDPTYFKNRFKNHKPQIIKSLINRTNYDFRDYANVATLTEFSKFVGFELDQYEQVIIHQDDFKQWNDLIMQNLNRFCRSKKQMAFHFIVEV